MARSELFAIRDVGSLVHETSEEGTELKKTVGVTQLTDTAQVIRVAAETMPSHRIDTERLLRARIVARMAERGIKSPPVPATSPPTPSV